MDAVKAEKQAALRRYRRIRAAQRAFRFLEAFAAVAAISWSSARLPGAARSAGEFLRAAATVALSPRFVFLIGNAIVAVLVAKSGDASAAAPPCSVAAGSVRSVAAADPFDEVLDTGGRIWNPALSASATEVEVVVYEDKAVCSESPPEKNAADPIPTPIGADDGLATPDLPLASAAADVRCEKDAAAVVADDGDVGGEDAEEFRRTIEAFIASMQLKFQREEITLATAAFPPQ